ncbi:MAG: spore coat protein [Firmicutes bacterium]|nr:spore coat protein [Bacillota bacterium]
MNTSRPGVRQNMQAQPPAKPVPPAKTVPASKKSEFAKDHVALDDVAIVSDVLSTQKGIIKMYGTALCEGSNEKIRHLCNTHLTELAADQFDSFLYMSQRNLYPTDPAPAPKLSEAKQKYKATAMKIK